MKQKSVIPGSLLALPNMYDWHEEHIYEQHPFLWVEQA